MNARRSPGRIPVGRGFRSSAALAVAIASAVVGCGEQAPERTFGGPGLNGTYFEERAETAGIDFVLDSGDDGGPKLFPEIMPGGAALVDVDGDGDLDLYLVQFGPIEAEREGDRRNRLYLNEGDGTFVDVTDGSGAEDPRNGCGVATGDYDGDGDVDLYVTNLGRNTLLRNEGQGRFTDVTQEAGVGESGWGASAVFLDHDLDGDQDLFVCNYIAWSEDREIECRNAAGTHDYCSPKAYEARTPDVLYRNEGDGTFTDVSAEAGIDVVAGNGLGVVTGDLDGDGHPDIFVANDGNPNHLFLGRGDGTFEEASRERGVYLAGDGNTRAGMGVVIGDPDDDGDLDILIVNLMNQTDSFFENDGGFFVERTNGTGLAAVTRRTTRFGVGWLDVDNDSRLDLFEASGRVMNRKDAPRKGDPFRENNHLMMMGEDDRYAKIAPREAWGDGLVHTSRGAVFGDVDGDGGVDIVVVNRDGPTYLLRNTADRGRWCGVQVLDRAGAPCHGAVVTGIVGDRRLRRDINPGYSYLCANEPVARFGLGEAAVLRDARVRWPDGREAELGDLDAGRIHVVSDGS